MSTKKRTLPPRDVCPKGSSPLLRSVCVPITARTAKEALRSAFEASQRVRWVEFRLDYLNSENEIEKVFRGVRLRLHRGNHFIFTLRRKDAGGFYQGTIAQQAGWLCRAAHLGDWIDLEIESARLIGTSILQAWRQLGARIILSHHNFAETPKDLHGAAGYLLEFQPDLVKIATQTQTIADGVRLLDLQQWLHHRKCRSVVLGMGPSGLFTRVLGPAHGAEFTFGTLRPEKQSAPGQPTVDELQSQYRIQLINSRTQLFGILGFPLSHSLSPRLYNVAFQKLKMDAVYLPFECATLDGFQTWTSKLHLRGLAVTLPHKSNVLKYVSTTEPLAKKIGAVNTLKRRGNRWQAFNTDFHGIEQAVAESKIPLKNARVLLLGAGGAARAAAALLKRKKSKVSIFNRTFKSARSLAREFGHHAVHWKDVQGQTFDLIINATPVGMWPNTEGRPIDLSRVKTRAVFDMVYKPLQTALLKGARRRGIKIVPGIKMFQAQAQRQFEILTGRRLPKSALKSIS